MTSSSDNSSAAGLSENFEIIEDDLKTAASEASDSAPAGSFSVWPAHYEGQKYLKIWFQVTEGGAAKAVMNVAVAERSSLVGQGVAFALARTTQEFTFANAATYYYAAADVDTIYVYYVDIQGASVAVGTWAVEKIGKNGEDHERFVAALKHNAAWLGLRVDG